MFKDFAEHSNSLKRKQAREILLPGSNESAFLSASIQILIQHKTGAHTALCLRREHYDLRLCNVSQN